MTVDRQSPNAVLAGLSPEDFEFVRPHLRSVNLLFGEVLVGAGERVNDVYFPHSGIVAKVLNFRNGGSAEVAMIGRDGVFGGTAALDGDRSATAGIVRVAGVASVVDLNVFRVLLNQSAGLRSALVRRLLTQVKQAERTVACVAAHSVEERLCRKLLESRDLTDSNQFRLTQDILAQTLAVQRNTISLVAHALQDAGTIRYSRGRLEITNVDDLIRRSCECYGVTGSRRENEHEHANSITHRLGVPIGEHDEE